MTPCNLSITRNNHDVISLQITDERSRVRVATVELSPHVLAMALTGRADMKADLTRYCSPEEAALIGREKSTERVQCPRYTDKNLQRSLVHTHFAESGLANDGWVLQNDGCTSQQAGDHHTYIIARWETADE